MSSPEGGGRAGGAGRGQCPSAAPGALTAGAASAGSASSRAGGDAARLAASALTPGAAVQPPASLPPTAVPGTADAPRAGLAALSLHTLGPVDGAAAGSGALATRSAPPPAATSRRAGGAAASSPGAAPHGAVEGGGGVPGQWPAAAAASPTPAGGPSVPGDGPPVPVGDDGSPLSAEVAASPFSPPASERHAAFLRLVDHGIKAGLHARHMRNADFSALAAEAGEPLFGDDSVIVANLRVSQAMALGNQADVEPDRPERVALFCRAWAVLLSQALPVLQSSLDEGTLLPGTLRKEEEAYCVYADAFVLATLRLIPKTAGLLYQITIERTLVDLIERRMTAVRYGADFCASVLTVWRSRAVVDVLRARGALQGSAAAVAADNAEFEARQKADLAKKGLRRCALPACGKQEATVLQFRVCGHCQTTRYCCPEHWKAHKREFEEDEEERGNGGGTAA